MKKYISVFCAILLVASIAFSATGCDLFKKEETTEETTLADLQDISNSPEALVAYYDQMVNKALQENPGGSVERKLDVKDLEVFKRGSNEEDDSLSTLKTALEQAKNYILTDVKNVEIDPNSTLFGESLSTLLYDITLGDISEIENAYYEEVVETDTETDEETTTINNTKIIIELADMAYPAPEGSKIARLFKSIDIESVRSEFEKLNNYLILGEAEDFSINYEGSTIVLEVDRKEDKITSVVLTKNVTVIVPAETAGNIESYGEVDIHFRLIDTTRFNFDWFDPNAELTSQEEE